MRNGCDRRGVPEIWVHDESPAVTEDSAMAKAPAGTTEDPAMVEEVGSEDELKGGLRGA